MKWNTENMATCYDELSAGTIPDMEHFYTAVTDAVPEGRIPVLELGCGTGLLTKRIRRMRPDAAVICIDCSSAMLAVARQNPVLGDVTLILGDIRDSWPEGPYGAVVSTFCLSALDPAEQQAVLKRAYDVLQPGGVCITGCVVRPETTEEEQRQLDRWVTFMKDNGLDPEEVRRQRASWDGAREKIPTAGGFVGMLDEAGFFKIECPYRRDLYAVFVAVR